MPRVASQDRPRTPAKPPFPVQTKRPSRRQLMWRKRKRLIRPVVGGVLAMAAILAVVNAIRNAAQPGRSIASLDERLGLPSPLLVQNVVLVGREKTPENFLRAALGVSRGDKLFGVSLEAARARIEKLTWVEHASVERRLPDTIVVTLEERRPIARWQFDHRVNLIDRGGNIVVEPDGSKGGALPLVVGAGAPQAAATLIDELAAVPTLRSRVDAMIRVGERRWNLHLSNGTEIMLPEVGETTALSRLMELQANTALLDRPVQAIDMRLADRLVVRPPDEAKPSPAVNKKST